jgi:gluconokinase
MPSLVVMGVSGCGKSSVAAEVAKRMQMPRIEGDEYHSESNRAKMAAGIALTDDDRAVWLDTLGRELARHPEGAVLTCSALKRAYRDALRAAAPGLRFAWLDLDAQAALARVSQRGAAHFFPPQLVANQFQTLEPPIGEAGVLRLDALLPLPALTDRVCAWMASPT